MNDLDSLNLNELGIDELEDINGGGLLADTILNNKTINALIRNNKRAGVALQECINSICSLLRTYIGRYISRSDVISYVTKIYDAIDNL